MMGSLLWVPDVKKTSMHQKDSLFKCVELELHKWSNLLCCRRRHEPHTTWFDNVFSSVYFGVSRHRVYIVKCTYCNKRKTNYHFTIQRVNEILELGCNFCHPSVFVEDQTGGQEKGKNSHKQDRDRCNLKAVSCLWGPLDEISIVRFYHLVVVAALRWKIASRDIIGWFQGLRLIYNIPIGKLQAEAPMANDFRGILPLIKKLQSAGVETLPT